MGRSHPPVTLISSIVFKDFISSCSSSAKPLAIADIQALVSTKQVIGTPSTTANDSLALPISLTSGSGLWYLGIFNISLRDPPVVPILLVIVEGWIPSPGEEGPPPSAPPHVSLPNPYCPRRVPHWDIAAYSAPIHCNGSTEPASSLS